MKNHSMNTHQFTSYCCSLLSTALPNELGECQNNSTRELLLPDTSTSHVLRRVLLATPLHQKGNRFLLCLYHGCCVP